MELLLYVITGAAGTGKTTLAEALVDEDYFEADKFAGIYDAEGKYVKEKQQDAHNWNYSQLQGAIQAKMSPIAVSNTSMLRKYYQEFIDLAIANGYTVKVVETKGVLYPDGSFGVSIHNVPQHIVDRTRCQQEPYVHRIKQPWHSNARLKDVGDKKVLRLLDRDRTLIYDPEGGISKFGNMAQIPGIGEKLLAWKAKGDFLVVVSNQAGIAAGHRTEEELLEEARLLNKWFPLDLQLYCPDWEGEQCLVYTSGLDKFKRVAKIVDNQSFRKPQAGMIEYAMSYFGSYEAIEMIGNGHEDYLAALAANIPYRHIHDVLFP
jgi:histidinol phosphatase-like enzyme/predicted kinase